MLNGAGQTFFAALAAVSAERLGADHAVARAARAAAGAPDPGRMAAAQAALGALDEAERTALLGAVHKAMREDMGAILGLWGGTGRPDA
ncbi:hypothetical protein LNKW23_23340 [Paralimibaculum aggregatum]|uniref:Uncharacterized protein n=1 Tax=Paralimibaculum aggregatum TaxID=3036245 RepID=A0ABQ6LQQ1_9RHOB|nr:hypothetical protein [Limibaculum sp. NKW23]GMG83121.1 hypothetical protein LNKW23_23340 [Limibaculum sp. NKW23]